MFMTLVSGLEALVISPDFRFCYLFFYCYFILDYMRFALVTPFKAA